VDLYTMGPGEDLFSKFGHAALCVAGDGIPEEGICYNYGTSDFSRPVGLGWEVVRGRAKFWVSVSDLEGMIESFAAEDRTIFRQSLPLSEKQAEKLAGALARDALPENREYVYNHFLENCSTRPRDHIDQATGGKLRRVDLPSVGTYRDYATEGLSRASGLLVPASDFLLGRWADRKIDAHAAMFIPDVLRAGVASAMGVAPEAIYERKGPPIPSRVGAGRRLAWIACFFAVAVFGGSLYLGTRGRRFFRKLGGGLLGGLGAILLFGALVSVLPELRRNELFLVFFPLDFFLLSSNLAFVVSYSTMRLAVLAVAAVLAALGVLIQPLWPFWLLSAGVLGVIRVGASGSSYTTGL
ncbi:MAG: DUF4105 domain-containing protein, partial [Vicinamibacteria bacterium]